jgi:hypothetical protein
LRTHTLYNLAPAGKTGYGLQKYKIRVGNSLYNPL